MRRQNPLSTLLLLAIDFSHHEDAPSLINDEPVCFMRGVLDFPAPSINQSVLILEIKKKKKNKKKAKHHYYFSRQWGDTIAHFILYFSPACLQETSASLLYFHHVRINSMGLSECFWGGTSSICFYLGFITPNSYWRPCIPTFVFFFAIQTVILGPKASVHVLTEPFPAITEMGKYLELSKEWWIQVKQS